MDEDINEAYSAPLCVFMLSSPFSVNSRGRPSLQPAFRCRPTRSWRHGARLLSFTRTGFKTFRRLTSYALAKYLADRIKRQRREQLSLQEVFNTITQVWTYPNSSSLGNMEDCYRKKNSNVSNISSHMLLRRRLSAPEAIMRKHMLAQERSESQDSDVTNSSDKQNCQWRMDLGSESDPNIAKKRDFNIMRKSTLIKRLWRNSKPLSERTSRFYGSYSEWQHGKLSTDSLSSTHSSLEQLKFRATSDSIVTPVHRKNNNKFANLSYEANKNLERNFEISLPNDSLVKDTDGYADSSVESSIFSMSNQIAASANESSVDTSLSTTKTAVTTETGSECYTTRNGTTFSNNSDSVYRNTPSDFKHSAKPNTTSEEFASNNEDSARDENLQPTINNTNEIPVINQCFNNNTESQVLAGSENYIKYTGCLNESTATQTTDVTNVNVISNVQLSQSTLNTIFNKVMQDVYKAPANVININTLSATLPHESDINLSSSRIETVGDHKTPSFYLKRKEEPEHLQYHRIVKYMISNVGTGSQYSKPAESPQIVVPRYSALPRTASMEVNISSGDYTGSESDNVSLVDSLEDPYSPRLDTSQDSNPQCQSKIENLSPLLPDNSNTAHKQVASKASAFFISIDTDENVEAKAVAEHLPKKMKDKLSKRQSKREQKLRESKEKMFSSKSDSNYVSGSDSGSHYCVLNNNDSYRSKRKPKPLLPSIESIRKIKAESLGNAKHEELEKNWGKRQNHHKSRSKSCDEFREERHISLSKSRTKVLEKLTPRFANVEVANANKRIEILEIVECVETASKLNSQQVLPKTGKSRIPVLVRPKLSTIAKQGEIDFHKPAFLNFRDRPESNPKLDVLIANILIDALNKVEVNAPEENCKYIEKQPTAVSPIDVRNANNRYQHKFAAIPEEHTVSLQSSLEETDHSTRSNENVSPTPKKRSIKTVLPEPLNPSFAKPRSKWTMSCENPKYRTKIPESYKGKAALAVANDECLTSIPKGWITFYTLRKSQASPESTSDEGKKKGAVDSNESNDVKKIAYLRDNIGETNKPIHLRASLSKQNNRLEDPFGTINAHARIKKQIVYRKDYGQTCNSADSFSSNEQGVKSGIPRQLLSPLGINDSFNKQNNPKKGNFKSFETANNKFDPGGWTVTVSGNANGQFAPDVEMHLKFPNQQNGATSQSDSGLGEEHPREKHEHFPRLTVVRDSKNNQRTAVDSCDKQKLPDVPKKTTRIKSKPYETSTDKYTSRPQELRPTRTGSKRFIAQKGRTQIVPSELLTLDAAKRKFDDILNKYPELLSVTGNAINPEHKPRVLLMSEKDLLRHFYHHI